MFSNGTCERVFQNNTRVIHMVSIRCENASKYVYGAFKLVDDLASIPQGSFSDQCKGVERVGMRQIRQGHQHIPQMYWLSHD